MDDCILKIGAISDIHINALKKNVRGHPFEFSEKWFKAALEYYKKQEADVLIIAGDYVDFTIEDNYKLFENVLCEVFESPEKAPVLVLAAGNHEFCGFRHENGIFHIPSLSEIYGLHRKYLSKWVRPDLWNGGCGPESIGETIQVYRTKDITVIGYSPDCEGGAYSKQSAERLDKILQNATKNSDKPVILAMHVPIGDFVMGGWSEVQRWRNPDADARISFLPEIFRKYSNLVILTGHTHLCSLAKNNISQDEGWTNINLGAVGIMALNNCIGKDDGSSPFAEEWTGRGHYIDNIAGDNYYPYDKKEEPLQTFKMNHEGLLLRYEPNFLKIDRVDLVKGAIYPNAESYIIPYGINASNKNNKFRYLIKDEKRKSKTDNRLVFDRFDKAEIYFEDGEVCVRFPSVENCNESLCYVVELYKNDALKGKKYWHGDFMLQPGHKKTYNVRFFSEIVGDPDGTEYFATVYARDFYGNDFKENKLKTDTMVLKSAGGNIDDTGRK